MVGSQKLIWASWTPGLNVRNEEGIWGPWKLGD